MQARMNNPVMVVPEAMNALQALHASVVKSDVPRGTINLVELRASQINGCAPCLEMHGHAARKAGETDERLLTLAAWRETPFFTDAERAALALTEAITRLADRPDAVSDEIWNEAARHYDEESLAALVLTIGSINIWNRINVATGQVAGQFPG